MAANEFSGTIASARRAREHGFIFQKIKSVAGYIGAAFKIDQIEFFGQLHVIQRFEI